MKKKTLFPRSAKGQSLVELAISLVVLLYLLSGAVEFGIIFFQYVQLRDAAQEGALYGSTKPDDVTGIIARARGSSQSPLALANGVGTVAVSIDGYASGTAEYNARDCEGSNHAVTVTLSYDHRIFMPFMPQLIVRSQIPLVATVTDTILSPRCP